MKNYDKKQALAIICSCAKSYEEKLNNKHFLIVYRDKNVVKECCVGLKQGYEIFGVLEDCPENHCRYYLKKKLK